VEARYIWCPNPSVWWSRCARHWTFWRSVYDLHKFWADTSSGFSCSRRSLDDDVDKVRLTVRHLPTLFIYCDIRTAERELLRLDDSCCT